MKERRKGEEGTIALEASIALSLFMFLMLLMYSFFTVFEAQYSIEHAILEAGKSMALETYATDKIVKAGNTVEYLTKSGSIGSIITQFGLTQGISNTDYIVFTKWYDDNAQTVEVAKTRFCAYFAGGESEADNLLQKLRVKDGLAGLDFSGTEVQGDELHIVVAYTNKLIFDFPAFHMGEINMSLSAKMLLWK